MRRDLCILPQSEKCLSYELNCFPFHSQMQMQKPSYSRHCVLTRDSVAAPTSRAVHAQVRPVHKPLLWSNNTGVSRVKSLCLSTLLCLIHKGVMKMVAPLLWKCNIAGCLQKWISGLLSFISLRFTAKSIKWWWAHNTEHRRSALVTGMLSEGHGDLYRDVCSPVCFYWNHRSCHVEISQTNTRQSFIRLHVLSTA